MTAGDAAAALGAPARPAGDDALDGRFVLHGRQLRSGTQLERTSRFTDDCWRLEPAQLQGHQSALALNFTNLPTAHRLVAKHLCYAMLSGPLPLDEARPSITNIRKNFSELRRFLVWLDAHDPTRRLGELTGADLVDYQRHLLATLHPAPRGRWRALPFVCLGGGSVGDAGRPRGCQGRSRRRTASPR